MLLQIIIYNFLNFGGGWDAIFGSTVPFIRQDYKLHSLINLDALLNSLLNPLEGPSVLSCGKLELGSHSRLPALKRCREAC